MKTVCVYIFRLTLRANLLLRLRLSVSVFTHCCCHSFSPPLSFCLFFGLVVVHLPSPVLSPLHPLPLSHSPFIALPLSLYLCVLRQSDTGAQRFGPTHHCDSHNRLTRENKFHSNSRILMDWAVFFLVMPFLFLFLLFGLVLCCQHLHTHTVQSIKSSSGSTLQQNTQHKIHQGIYK